MAKRKKTWREKLADAKDLPKVEPIAESGVKIWGSGTIAIPAPAQVDAIMRRVPAGSLITINEIRRIVAQDNGATIGCPITCGIFAWVAAHAAEEARADGETDITPYWRTLKAGGELNPKYPGGLDHLKTLLEAEGHQVIVKGKRWLVVDSDKKIMKTGT